MEIDKNLVTYDGNKNFLRFFKQSKVKEIITALKRTPRWDIYSDQEKMKIYHTLTKREFTGSLENKDQVTEFVNETLYDLNDKKREPFVNNEGFLKGTLNEDGNTWNHTKGQRKLAKKYGKIDLESEYLSQEQYTMLITTMDIHDIGEGARGDVVYDKKNTNNEDFEKQCGEIILDSILKDEYKKNGIAKYIQEAYDINFNKNHKLHIVFKTYEIFSYLKGAMIATTNKEIQYPHRLVHNVLINQIKRLPELKKEIPSVTQFIQDYKQQIDQLFVFVENSDFLSKSAPNGKSKEEYITAFEEAKAIWENGLK